MSSTFNSYRDGGNERPRRRGLSKSLRERYPVFFAFGDEPTRFLTHDEAIAASPQERIQSVWPFLVNAVLKFQETLRPRERANFDAEDVLTELYVKLMEKDAKWEPERGKYITFCARVIYNEFIKLRDRTRVVRSPGNSYSRLKEYEAEEVAETITPERLATLGAIRRALQSTDTIDGIEPVGRELLGPADAVEKREALEQAFNGVVQVVMCLTAEEAFVVGQAYGLFGQAEKSLDEIASARGYTRAGLKASHEASLEKMRKALDAMRHPAIYDYFCEDES